MKTLTSRIQSLAALFCAVVLCGCGGSGADQDNDNGSKPSTTDKPTFTVTGTLALPSTFAGTVEGVGVFLIKPENFPPSATAMPDVMLLMPTRVEGISVSSPYAVNVSKAFDSSPYHVIAIVYVTGGGFSTLRPISNLDYCYGNLAPVSFETSPVNLGELMTVVCP